MFANGGEGVMRVESGVDSHTAARGSGVQLQAQSAQLSGEWAQRW